MTTVGARAGVEAGEVTLLSSPARDDVVPDLQAQLVARDVLSQLAGVQRVELDHEPQAARFL